MLIYKKILQITTRILGPDLQRSLFKEGKYIVLVKSYPTIYSGCQENILQFVKNFY